MFWVTTIFFSFSDMSYNLLITWLIFFLKNTSYNFCIQLFFAIMPMSCRCHLFMFSHLHFLFQNFTISIVLQLCLFVADGILFMINHIQFFFFKILPLQLFCNYSYDLQISFSSWFIMYTLSNFCILTFCN